MADEDSLGRLVALIGCYALGCFATGYYLVRLRTGGDLRRLGSGTVGATNVGRVLGSRAYAATALADIAKGAVAVLLSRRAGLEGGWLAAAALAVAAGHVWPAQLGFRGGKGVATSFGALLGIDPFVALLGLAGSLLARACRAPRAAAGMLGFALMPGAAFTLQSGPASAISAALVAALFVVTHRRDLREELRRWRGSSPGPPLPRGSNA
jgi:glycerol-3-phosphate acyltransferase PlsY